MADIQFIDPDNFIGSGAGYAELGNVASFNQNGSVLDFGFVGQPGVRVIFLDDEIFRVRFSKAGDYSQDHSYAIDPDWHPAFNLSPVTVRDGNRVATTANLEVVFESSPFRIKVFRNGELLSADDFRGLMYHTDPSLQRVACYKSFNPSSYFYGFGEKTGFHINKQSRTMTFFNFDNFRAGSDDKLAMYVSIPWMIEMGCDQDRHVYGILLDNPSQTFFDLGAQMPDFIHFGAAYGELNYYFVGGENLREVLARYTTMTGRSAMPPKFALGYHQGCYGYNTADKLRAAADAYRASGIPIDGLHIDIDFQANYRTFTTEETRWPNNAQVVRDLAANGFKCSTNITSMIRNDPFPQFPAYSVRDAGFRPTPEGGNLGVFLEDPSSNGEAFIGTVNYGPRALNQSLGNINPQGFFPDFTRPSTAAWWADSYRHILVDVGIEMVWQDMMCPALDDTVRDSLGNYNNKTLPPTIVHFDFGRRSHNIAIHNHAGNTQAAATVQGFAVHQPNKRPFIIARGGYAGIQRYAALWTGDSSSSWEDYRRNIPMVIGLGLSGVPITGSDIGGFATGDAVIDQGVVQGDLLIRWTTMGAFLPWFRNHYYQLYKPYQEPFHVTPTFPGSAYGQDVLDACKKYIELRYRLLPLFYDLMWEHTQTGLPITRPLFIDSVDEPSHDFSDVEFMLGDDLLIAPVLARWVVTKSVWLPSGSDWYRFEFTAAAPDPFAAPLPPVVPGGRVVGLNDVDLDEVPTFVRAGAILPTTPLRQWVQDWGDPLTVQVYPGPDRSHIVYRDDERTLDYKRGVNKVVQISQTTTPGVRTLVVDPLSGSFVPRPGFLFLRLLGIPSPPTGVQIDGAVAPAMGAAGDGFTYEAATQSVLVRVLENGRRQVAVHL